MFSLSVMQFERTLLLLMQLLPVPPKTSTGNNFPRAYQRIPQNCLPIVVRHFVKFLISSAVQVIFQAPQAKLVLTVGMYV